MPAANDAALLLSEQLRSLPDGELADVLNAREIRAAGIRDFFDLAEALLDPDSIQHALGRLDRPTLATLAAISDLGSASEADAAAHLAALGAPASALSVHLADAVHLGLATVVRATYVVPPSVSAALEAWPNDGLPGLEQLTSTPAPAALAPVSTAHAISTDQVAAEHAFTTTTSVAELLTELAHESARELARGGVALPDSKRLAVAMGVDLDRVPGLLEIASRAGLTALDGGRWMPTDSSSQWLVDSSSERWSLLATAWLQRLPIDIRTVLRERAHATWGDRLDEYLAWLYPAGGEWMRDRVLAYTRDAELLGITANYEPSSPGAALLSAGAEPAAALMAQLFPPEVHEVYVQPDLTIVSPGPLAAALDARLRTMADAEGRALACTYRVSTASVYRAMAAGETAESMREFLDGISLTGIPQPLDYLLDEASARYGLVRVGALDGGRSYIRSTDATLLRTLAIDHSISALGLSRSGDALETRFELEVAFWSLSDARYPVAAENASGEVIVLQRRQADRSSVAPVVDATAALIERLRLGSSADPGVTGKAWLSRQLDIAIKSKAALTVTVQMPDGSAIDYVLEPSSVAGGRLRALDRNSDIERTLPLASITAVAPA